MVSVREPREGVRGADESIELRRYIEAVRRSGWLLVAIVVGLVAQVLLISLLLPPRFEATARLVVDPSLVGFGADAATLERELATIESLATTPIVLQAAARDLGQVSAAQLEDRVESSVDPEANVITVDAEWSNAELAAASANAVAEAFVAQQTRTEARRLESARTSLEERVAVLGRQPDPSGNVRQQVRALQERIAELSVSAASAGASLQIAQRAEVPRAQVSPKPLRNSVVALFAGLLIGVIAALAREQLSPRIASRRELGQLLGLPLLGTVPNVPRRFRRRRVVTSAEHEAYQSLAATLRLALPPDRVNILLISSALHGEGKTTIASNLGRLLSQAGHNTLVVSADLRRPRLDEVANVTDELGFADLLTLARDDKIDPAVLVDHLKPLRQVRDPHAGTLEILPSGSASADPGRLLSGGTVGPVFEALREYGATYVIVDAPPLLGIADTQQLATCCDHLVVVSRLNRLTLSAVADLRDAVDRAVVNPLGAVVVGETAEGTPYYAPMRQRPAEPLDAIL